MSDGNLSQTKRTISIPLPVELVEQVEAKADGDGRAAIQTWITETIQERINSPDHQTDFEKIALDDVIDQFENNDSIQNTSRNDLLNDRISLDPSLELGIIDHR